MKRLRYYLLPIVYLLLGSGITALLLQRVLFSDDAGLWVFLGVPMLMLTVLVTVVGVVNVWVSYRSERDAQALRQYSRRQYFWLYARCWSVVMAGLMLGIIFRWVAQLLPPDVQPLVDSLKVSFYVICAMLTLAALMSIVMGENLAEVRLRNAQNENQLLKSQLNPHFLYNTLNNIDALVWLDQERASAAVTCLSSLMRRFTYAARQEMVPLSDEVEALRQLIELHRLRITNAESLVFEVEEPLPNLQVAPLILMPLVENCFKHSGALVEPRAIVVTLQFINRRLVFSTDNNLPLQKETQPKGGLGLDVLRRRLQLLYPRRHTFTAGVEGNRFKTKLIISC